jgi:uncharacterized OsmC-like protein
MTVAPRRIAKIAVEIKLSTANQISEKDREILVKTGGTCPVARSLHPEVELDISYTQ